MQNLIKNYTKWQKSKNIAELVSLIHLNFEFIHPFIDGNGRTGTLLLNLILMQNGYPPINIKFSNHKKYYDCFENYYNTQNPTALCALVAFLMIETLSKYIDIIKD